MAGEFTPGRYHVGPTEPRSFIDSLGKNNIDWADLYAHRKTENKSRPAAVVIICLCAIWIETSMNACILSAQCRCSAWWCSGGSVVLQWFTAQYSLQLHKDLALEFCNTHLKSTKTISNHRTRINTRIGPMEPNNGNNIQKNYILWK